MEPVMAIVARAITRMHRRFGIWRTPISASASRSILAGLLLLICTVYSQAQTASSISLQQAFNNGSFGDVVRLAELNIAHSRKKGAFSAAFEAGLLKARALIQLEKYDEAKDLLDELLSYAQKSKRKNDLALVYLTEAGLFRLQRDFKTAIQNAKSGLSAAPDDPQVKLEYSLAIGRILYSSEFDIAAIVWLEQAEKLSEALPASAVRLDVLGHLSFAWASKFNYQKAVGYAEKLVKASQRSEFKYRHRLALFELANLLSSIGQERRAQDLLEKGVVLSMSAKNDYQSSLFLSTLLLTALYNGDISSAEKHLSTLSRVDTSNRFLFESTLGKAVVAGLKGQRNVSEEYFTKLASLKNYSEHIIPYWKATLAEKRQDWEGLIEQANILRKVAEEGNFRDDLPGIELELAQGYHGLGKLDQAFEHAKLAATIIESDRPSGDAPLSLSLLETYHSVYRLMAEIEEKRGHATASFELADRLKAQVLKDRIDNSALRPRPDIGTSTRQEAADLSSRLISGDDVDSKLAELERSATLSVFEQLEPKLDLGAFGDLRSLDGVSLVSYLFTAKGELLAYVVENGKDVRIVKLSMSEHEADKLATSVRTKIRDRIFFKRDGKEIYDRLIAPLSLTATHIIVVPDKSLWKIPFHALSSDGVSYLIEQRTISYAPSVSMLLNELKRPAPIRKTMQVFANDSFEGRYLTYVNREAANVARVFSSRPLINATRTQFLSTAGRSDLLHFSMHAQTDADEPLDSFLAFKSNGRDSGKVTVGNLLNVQLKKQSLSFLASCESNNVLNGEGLVSLAWALLGSGNSSVISSQWEANDRSTEIFTEKFYQQYKKGKSAAKALQAASIAMIKDKSSESHEPYFWAAFTLLGDYR